MIEKIKLYFQGVNAESKKISWPSRKQVKNHTLIVIVAIIISMIFFGLVDLGLTKVLEFFIIKG